MANQALLNNVAYLERLLCDMQDRITRMTKLTNSIQAEELYYVRYEMPLNIFKFPKELRFHPIIKFLLWLCFGLYLVAGGAAWSICLLLLPVNLYFMKRNRSLLISLAVGFFSFYIYIISPMLFIDDNPMGGHLTSVKFCLACVLAYGITYLFGKWRIKQTNAESDIENDMTSKQNELIRSRNQQLRTQCKALGDEVRSLQTQVSEAVRQMGFPPDYVCLDAVRFFIRALRNDRADNFRQLIDLYESNNYRRQMVQGQQELNNLMNQQIYNQERMSQLLAFSNGLSAANLAAQIQNNAEIRALNRAVGVRPSDYD